MGKTCSNLCGFGAKVDEQTSERSDASKIEHKRSLQDRKSREKNKFQMKGPEMDSKTATKRNFNQVQNQHRFSVESRETIKQAINSHFILRNLSEESKPFLILSMKKFVIGAREVIFEQGEPADMFYVLETGRLEVIINGVRKAIINAGSSFGELALIEHTSRTATIKTLELCIVWGLDQKTFRTALEQINIKRYEENRKLIDSVSLFKELLEDQKERLISVFTIHTWPANSEIIREGESGNSFYIIYQGKVACYVNDQKIREMGPSEYFGELALLENSKRTASIISLEDVSLISVSREQLELALGENLKCVIYQNSQRLAIQKSRYLNFLTVDQINRIVTASKIVKYNDKEIVVPCGERKGHKLYTVISGSVINGDKLIDKMNCIGDAYIVKNSNYIYQSDCLSNGSSVVAECYKERIEGTLNMWMKNAKITNELIKMLKKIPIFRLLPMERLEDLASTLRLTKYSDGTPIVNENDQADTFFLIKSGLVNVIKNNTTIRSLSDHNYFGERSILMNEERTATVVAVGTVTCWLLERNSFLNIIDENVRSQMLRRIVLQDDSITIEHLIPIKTLGEGSYGVVVLANHSIKNVLYAVKCMERKTINKHEMRENVNNERTILMKLDHPFIMKMVKLLKEKKRIYIISEYVKGEDLFDVLSTFDILCDYECKFYTASLITILTYLHKKHIVYRDLKPENVMVDEDGYLKLIDFGTAKVIYGRTYTTIGTPMYMAPEVIIGEGYGESADLWSLGVMLYEFIYGRLPFGNDAEDAEAVYKSVLEDELNVPSIDTVTPKAIVFLKQLLNKKPYMRCQNYVGQLMGNPWFNEFRWNDLLLKKLKAPYCPKVRRITELTKQAMDFPEKFVDFIHTKNRGSII